MIDARQNGKDRLTQRIQAANLVLLSDAEFLRVVAKIFVGGGPVDEVACARLLSIAATCEENEEASE